MLVRRITLPWAEIRRVRIWREGATLLFFRPAFWQVAAVRCPYGELAAAEALVRKKLKRNKKAKEHAIRARSFAIFCLLLYFSFTFDCSSKFS